MEEYQAFKYKQLIEIIIQISLHSHVISTKMILMLNVIYTITKSDHYCHTTTTLVQRDKFCLDIIKICLSNSYYLII